MYLVSTSLRSLHRVRDDSLESFGLKEGDEVVIDNQIYPTAGCLIAVRISSKRAIGKFWPEANGRITIELPHCQTDFTRCEYLGVAMPVYKKFPTPAFHLN